MGPHEMKPRVENDAATILFAPPALQKHLYQRKNSGSCLSPRCSDVFFGERLTEKVPECKEAAGARHCNVEPPLSQNQLPRIHRREYLIRVGCAGLGRFECEGAYSICKCCKKE